MNRIILLIFVSFGLFMACDEPVTIDVDQIDSIVVIEGLVTDQDQYHYVRVTNSVQYYANGGARPITDAFVTVEDNEGNTFIYQHNPTDAADSLGYYISSVPFAGKIGNSYTLNVAIGSDRFTATDELLRVTQIDSLTIELDEEEYEDPDDPEYFYEILFWAKEPQETDDYYLFKFYRNDSLLLESETDIYFSDDEVLAEQINGIPTAGYYKQGDMGKVEMYSLSHRGFIYFNDLINLLNSDGGMFGSPPVNPRTNLSNGAMGFFQVSAVVSESIKIE